MLNRKALTEAGFDVDAGIKAFGSEDKYEAALKKYIDDPQFKAIDHQIWHRDWKQAIAPLKQFREKRRAVKYKNGDRIFTRLLWLLGWKRVDVDDTETHFLALKALQREARKAILSNE